MAEELIETAPEDTGVLPRAGRWAAGAFLAVILITGGVEIIAPPQQVTLVGQELRDARNAAADTSFWDGSLAQSYESQFKLRGRVRRLLAPYWAALILRLGDTPGDDIIVGRDGWLFFRNRTILRETRKKEGREVLANLYGLTRRSLLSDGIHLVSVPIPRKAAICADFLPSGLDSDPGYDATVVEALRLRGVETIDLWDDWLKLLPEERYLRNDTHWALKARLETAKYVARRATGFPRKTSKFSYRYGDAKTSSGALRYAGVDRGHPAERYFDLPEDREVLLIPEGAEEAINSREVDSEVLLAGSSFSAAYWLQAIFCNMLQSPVEDASEEGQPPLYSLRKALITRKREDLPRFVISEFPIHQAVETGRGTEATIRAALGIARHMNYRDRVQVLDKSLFAQPTRSLRPELNQSLIHFSAGTVLSSGDGVLGLQMTVESDERTRWQINASGTIAEIRTNPGVKVRAIPIVESGASIEHFAFVRPLNDPALEAQLEAQIVTDADVAGGQRFGGPVGQDGRWRHDGAMDVAELDSLALTWDEFTSGEIKLAARGTDRGGAETARTWTFEDVKSARFLIVTLGPFEGGTVESLELTGGAVRVQGVLAPQLEE